MVLIYPVVFLSSILSQNLILTEPEQLQKHTKKVETILQPCTISYLLKDQSNFILGDYVSDQRQPHMSCLSLPELEECEKSPPESDQRPFLLSFL